MGPKSVDHMRTRNRQPHIKSPIQIGNDSRCDVADGTAAAREPTTSTGAPPFSIPIGDINERGCLPGASWFAFGTPPL